MPYVQFFSVIASYIESIITQGGYAILFFTTAFEGIPLFGMVIPGHITIILSGFLAKMGTLSLGYVLLVAVCGAILGDYIGFYIGKKYGFKFIEKLRPYFYISDDYITKAQDLISKHTGKALIIGRFNPVTRALMPFLVGSSDAPVHKFWFFNILGGATWVLASVFAGYLFGSGYSVISGYFGKAVVLAIILGFLIVWGYRFVNLRFHIFAKYELFTLILNLIALGFLTITIRDAWTAPSVMSNFDVQVNLFMTNAWPFLQTLAHWVSEIGGTIVMIVLGFALTIWYAWKKKYRSAAVMFLAISSTAFLTVNLKEFFLRTRPLDALQTLVNDPSFPSGHSSMSAAFFFVLAYLVAPKIHNWVKRESVFALCTFAVIAIGMSRLILNVHWASDVIAGWSLGIFCASASVLFVRYIGTLFIKKYDLK